MALRIGIGLPFVDERGAPHDLATLSQRARWVEEAGFSTIWMGDASFRTLTTWPDPSLWMLTAAMATKHIELGFAALQIPLRSPLDNARRLATLHEFSRGRLSAGVAPGSTELGFQMLDGDFAGRFARFHRDMEALRRWCRGEAIDGVRLLPEGGPSREPRFLLAAWSGGRMLERAVRDYHGWLCSAGRTTTTTIVEGIARYRDLGGRRAIVASTRCDLTGPSAPVGDDDPFTLVCSPAEAADRLAWLEELGFDDVVVNLEDGRGGGLFTSDLARDRLFELSELHPPAPPLTRTTAAD